MRIPSPTPISDSGGLKCTSSQEPPSLFSAQFCAFYRVDTTGRILDRTGATVEGYRTNPEGKQSGPVKEMVLPICGLLPPTQTSKMAIAANLDNSGPSQPFDPNDPDFTSVYGVSMHIFDARGGEHPLSTHFSKLGRQSLGEDVYPCAFSYNLVCETAELTGASGRLYFDSNGSLQVVNHPCERTARFTASFDPASPDQEIEIDFGRPLKLADNVSDGGMTCWSGGNVPGVISQNGFGADRLRYVSLGEKGYINGSAGRHIRPIARLFGKAPYNS